MIPGNNGRAYAFDIEGEARFGNVVPFDSELFSSPREYAEMLLAGTVDHRYSPLDVADWLEDLAGGAEHALVDLKATRDYGRPAAAAAGHRCGDLRRPRPVLRRAVPRRRLRRAVARNARDILIETVLDYARRSVSAWETIAALSREVYHTDLTYGPQSWMRGSWHSRLEEIRAEILDIEASRGALKNYTGAGQGSTTAATAEVERALQLLAHRSPVESRKLETVTSARLVAGEAFEVRVAGKFDAAPTLHFRHVNQAERWSHAVMEADGDGYKASVPAAYTDSDYHLQYFVSAKAGGVPVISPGLDADLANEPYHTALHG